MMLVAFVAVLALALLLRLLPVWVAPGGAGVDQWFWKAYIERLRATRQFPPELPQFIYDEKQWYPPLFPWLLSRLPASAFDQYGHVFADAIDLLRMALLFWATWTLTGSYGCTLVAGIAYACTPLLISYNMQLNPRGLGALLLDSALLLVGAILLFDAPAWLWILAAILTGLMLITHKMTTQLFCFLCLAGASVAGEWRLAAMIPVSVLTALLLSRGFYLNVLRAHWDIVSFWHRNWRWLAAHPVRESPIYGEAGYETPTKYFRSGVKGWIRRIQFLGGFNPWAWSVLILAGAGYLHKGIPARQEVWVLGWLTLTLAFSLLTTVMPWMRSLGNGYLYGYNSIFPAALALGLSFVHMRESPLWWALVGLTLFACAAGIMIFLRTLRNSRTLKVDVDLDRAMAHIAQLPRGVVMCLPSHWHDVVAYRTGQPVAYGAHGYGFRRIEHVFPRLMIPIKDVIRRDRIRYLLSHEGYLPENFILDLPKHRVEGFGAYRIYSFDFS